MSWVKFYLGLTWWDELDSFNSLATCKFDLSITKLGLARIGLSFCWVYLFKANIKNIICIFGKYKSYMQYRINIVTYMHDITGFNELDLNDSISSQIRHNLSSTQLFMRTNRLTRARLAKRTRVELGSSWVGPSTL